MSATFSDSPDSARLDTDLHVRLRKAREQFGTPGNMARCLAIATDAAMEEYSLTAADRANLLALVDDLETLAYWCASSGAS